MIEQKHRMSPDLCESKSDSECNNILSQAPATVDALLEVAKTRWLKVPEMEYFLDPETTPLPILKKPPCCRPPSGTVLLFDRNVTVNYKEDGYHWVKKRNSQKTREDHVKLRANGQYRVAGIYCHSTNPVSFHRRAYHLLDPSTGITKTPVIKKTKGSKNKFNVNVRPSLVLVHYLDTLEAAEYACASIMVGKEQSKAYFGKKRQSVDDEVSAMKKLRAQRTPCEDNISSRDEMHHFNWSIANVLQDNQKVYKPVKSMVETSTPILQDSISSAQQDYCIWKTSLEVSSQEIPEETGSSAQRVRTPQSRPEEVLSLNCYPDNIFSFYDSSSMGGYVSEDEGIEKPESCDKLLDVFWDLMFDTDGNVEKLIEDSRKQ